MASLMASNHLLLNHSKDVALLLHARHGAEDGSVKLSMAN
jgi:hypothetical protein